MPERTRSFRQGTDYTARSCGQNEEESNEGYDGVAAKGIALAPTSCPPTPTPLNSPSAFAILKAELCSRRKLRRSLSYFMTRHLHRRHIGDGRDAEDEGRRRGPAI